MRLTDVFLRDRGSYEKILSHNVLGLEGLQKESGHREGGPPPQNTKLNVFYIFSSHAKCTINDLPQLEERSFPLLCVGVYLWCTSATLLWGRGSV